MEKETMSALVALLLIFGAVTTEGSLLNLQTMVRQVTGKNAAVDLAMYGCHCGVGGTGRPVDSTDWCCHYHDCCYAATIKKGCKPKTGGYSHTYRNKNVYCGRGTQCQKQVCECDRKFVLCLKKHSGSYKKSYRYHMDFLCRGSTPGC